MDIRLPEEVSSNNWMRKSQLYDTIDFTLGVIFLVNLLKRIVPFILSNHLGVIFLLLIVVTL